MEDICGIKQSPCMIRMQHIGIRNMKSSSFLKKESWKPFLCWQHINHEILALQKRLQEFEAYEKKLDTWKMQL